ncbi:RNA-binding transcriptional accessory protein [Anoxybacter fermentans]|uniref:RNA-binding transcriptional accessory protein n=2 Tax=Bacteria TaxID=2 RepID=A0A3Q9HS79_9FIRM|nr:Tex family protein [Anoxybacter fermentans]AZR74599.1 RNA-binding transcriptional accessory protein [Anoxybacter fermentans]
MSQHIYQRLAEELNLKLGQVERTVTLLDEGNTIPFIARYRKEVTGSLNEEQLRNLADRLNYLRNLEARKEEVIRLIDEQGKLTPELKEAILSAQILQEVEDLYRPYRPKRRTRATKAKEQGLEPLALTILAQELTSGDLEALAAEYIDPEKELEDVEAVLQGARDIIAEMISDDAEVRKFIRKYTFDEGIIQSEGKTEEITKFEMYYDYKEAVKKIPPHRILAINRGEKEEVLKVKIITPVEQILAELEKRIITNENSIFVEQLKMAIEDSYNRLMAPSIEREIRSYLTEQAEEYAFEIFKTNLRNLLLQPPVRDKVVMGIDPGYRTGSKVVVVDETGKLLDTATIYPHPPQNEIEEAKEILKKLIDQYRVDIIAIGNGTASRETELLIANLINEISDKVQYIVVDEAGASVYSASKLAREEFPELDVSMRGAVSIARRLQDPLAELVKIDPKSIGVGMYQHDVNQTRLGECLNAVVESVVNYVGVDLNTASPSLLQYVSGINAGVAKNIVKYREENGKFSSRKELKNVPRLGEKTFVQAAGFLRIPDSKEDPFANTPIHPESYDLAEKMLAECNYLPEDLLDREKLPQIKEDISKLDIKALAEKLNAGLPTLQDIAQALMRPGRDPREELPKPVFRTDVMTIEDLKPDMILQGTVRNVVPFGAFVDIGVKEDGLVHISEMSYDYVKDPLDVVSVGDIIKVKVLKVDQERRRIALTMKL